MHEEDLVQWLMMEEGRSAMSIFMAYSANRFEAAFNMNVWLKTGFIPRHIKAYCREELRKVPVVREVPGSRDHAQVA